MNLTSVWRRRTAPLAAAGAPVLPSSLQALCRPPIRIVRGVGSRVGREQAGRQSVLLETSSIVFAGTESGAVSLRDTLRAGQATKSTSLPCHRPLSARGGRRIVVALTEQGNRYSSSHSCWRRLVTGKGVATAKGGAIGREGATQYRCGAEMYAPAANHAADDTALPCRPSRV